MVNSLEWMLFEHLVAVAGTGIPPQLAMISLVIAVTLIAVAVVLLQVVGVLRFTPASSIRLPAWAAATPRGRTVRVPARARAPSADRELARA